VNRSVGKSVARGVIFLIQLYRHTISPMRLPTCRFTPTCSQYAVEALDEYGLIKGGWLGIVRLLKCGPWHGGGWDPIPERRDAHEGCVDVDPNPHERAVDGPVLREESETRV
jgi:putative membrane protein insertion efficiency factor